MTRRDSSNVDVCRFVVPEFGLTDPCFLDFRKGIPRHPCACQRERRLQRVVQSSLRTLGYHVLADILRIAGSYNPPNNNGSYFANKWEYLPGRRLRAFGQALFPVRYSLNARNHTSKWIGPQPKTSDRSTDSPVCASPHIQRRRKTPGI